MSLISGIGHTPMVECENLWENRRVRIFAKLEGCNPGGSIKDRTALSMIQKAEASGALSPGKIILEPTSGNTGIAIAMIGAAKGYRVKLCMPQCVSMERRRILEALGAEVVLTEACEKTDGAIRAAHQVFREDPDAYYMPNQFDNPANWLAHYETTGPEIWEQMGGRLDAVVAGMGTTGTLMGLSRFFREKGGATRVVAVEPVVGHAIQGLKNMKEAIVPGIYDRGQIDEQLTVEDEEAFSVTRMLATREGIFCGMSSGAAMAGALRFASGMKEGTVVVILPDRGDRYLSTNLFQSICGQCPP